MPRPSAIEVIPYAGLATRSPCTPRRPNKTPHSPPPPPLRTPLLEAGRLSPGDETTLHLGEQHHRHLHHVGGSSKRVRNWTARICISAALAFGLVLLVLRFQIAAEVERLQAEVQAAIEARASLLPRVLL
jgi:hypothetical protein